VEKLTPREDAVPRGLVVGLVREIDSGRLGDISLKLSNLYQSLWVPPFIWDRAVPDSLAEVTGRVEGPGARAGPCRQAREKGLVARHQHRRHPALAGIHSPGRGRAGATRPVSAGVAPSARRASKPFTKSPKPATASRN